MSQEHALTVEHARPVARSFLELMRALLAQRAIMQVTVFLKKVILVLGATAPHLLMTVNKSAKVKDEGKKILVWLLKSIQ